MYLIFTAALRFTLVLIFGVFVISGCSSGDSQSPSTNEEGISNSENVPADENTIEPTENLTESSTDDTVVSDPEVQNSTRVDFNITVPALISDALQIHMVWGEKNIAVDWIGDSYWTASALFPTNVRLPLTVTLYGWNGDLTFGVYRTDFQAGTNAAETYTITADQFDTESWDNDGDGVSNIDEHIAGTNPFMDESTDVEVLDFPDTFYGDVMIDVLERVSEFYESSIPAERPYSEQSEVSASVTSTLIIDLDESGNGSYSEVFEEGDPGDITRRNRFATRTNTGNSIQWMGSYKWTNSNAGNREELEFTTETKLVDLLTRSQSGEIMRDASGYGYANGKSTISYSLIGKVMENDYFCEPIAGTIVHDEIYGLRTDGESAQIKISKSVDDPYWAVSVVSLNGQVLEEYLVRSLLEDRYQRPTGGTFYCAFGDQILRSVE